MMLKRYAGTTSLSIPVIAYDTSNSTGAKLGSLVYNTAGLTARYRRQGQSTWTTITLANATVGTWTSGGFVANGGESGDYEFGVPDACLAAGASWVQIQIRGATSMQTIDILIELDAVNYQSNTGFVASIPAVIGSVGSISGVTFPTNFNSFAIDASGRVDVGKILGTASQGAAGYVGVDWSKVVNQSSSVNLSGTTISINQVIASVANIAEQTGDSYTLIGAGGSGLTALGDTRLDYLDAAISSRSDFDSTTDSVTLGDKTGFSLASDGVDLVVIETDVNMRQAISAIAAACAGESSGVSSGSPVFKGIGVDTTRITATATNGNRSSVTLSLPE